MPSGAMDAHDILLVIHCHDPEGGVGFMAERHKACRSYRVLFKRCMGEAT
jgi:hypothetical protein